MNTITFSSILSLSLHARLVSTRLPAAAGSSLCSLNIVSDTLNLSWNAGSVVIEEVCSLGRLYVAIIASHDII